MNPEIQKIGEKLAKNGSFQYVRIFLVYFLPIFCYFLNFCVFLFCRLPRLWQFRVRKQKAEGCPWDGRDLSSRILYVVSSLQHHCLVTWLIPRVRIVCSQGSWLRSILVAIYRAMRLRFVFRFESCNANGPRNVKKPKPCETKACSPPTSPCWW